MLKRMIYRIVAIVIIVAGFKFAWNSRKPSTNLTPEQEYTQKMTELSSRYEAIEKEGEAANDRAATQPAKTPGSAADLLNALSKVHQEKDQYLADLQSLNVPKKYEEAHATFLAWKKQEQETEGQLIEGYKQFSAGKKDVEAKIDSMIQAGDRLSKEYEDKLSSIAKKNGFDSFQKFLGQRISSDSKP
jgi:predicted  nucleic acid-binding Zn-ribbon protein